MSSLFITVLNMSLTAGYAALIVIVLRFFFIKVKAPGIFSYALWAVVLFRLVCPLSFESYFSLIPDKADAIPHDIIYSQNPSINTGIGMADKTINQAVQASLPPAYPAASVNPMGIIMEVAAYIWILGIIILLVHGFVSYFRLKFELSTSTLINNNVFETDRIQTPFVMGLLKPRIYIPTGLDGNKLDYIIKHEQMHIRRYDFIIKPIAYTALAIHWFNPLIWLSYHLMVSDMEMSCDESVIKQSEEDIRINYSNSLLELSVKQSRLLSPLAFGESSVKSRIKNVLNYKKPALWVIIAAIALVLVVTAALISDPKGENKKDLKQATAEELLKYKTEYVGDAPKVSNISLLLDFPKEMNRGSLELSTKNPPYGIKINLNTDIELRDYFAGQGTLAKNAAIMFSLIGNVDNIEFNASDGKGNKNLSKYIISFERSFVANSMGGDVREYSKGEEEFTQFLSIAQEFGTEFEIKKLVESFGGKLKMVSLLASEDMVKKQIQENYSAYVTQTLIDKWINDPQNAPGRVASSPWPDRIEILSVMKISEEEYEVKGNIVEVTSVELTSGGAAAKRPITLAIKKSDGRWLIEAINIGSYESSSSFKP